MNGATSKIFGYCPGNLQTARAVRVTVCEVDGESLTADTVWLPRSICEGLTVKSVRNEDGTVSHEVRATVPAWWTRKLDSRPGWVRRGESRPPMAQRPW